MQVALALGPLRPFPSRGQRRQQQRRQDSYYGYGHEQLDQRKRAIARRSHRAELSGLPLELLNNAKGSVHESLPSFAGHVPIEEELIARLVMNGPVRQIAPSSQDRVDIGFIGIG